MFKKKLLGGVLITALFVFMLTACEGPMGPEGPQGTQGEKGDDGQQGIPGVSIVWRGELATAPASPVLNWAYYNTTDKRAYIWDGSAWQMLAQDGATGATGADGVSISWRGEFATAPANPQLNWAYYNSTQGVSYIWNGSAWQVLARDGAPGTSMAWRGELATAPANPVLNWAYYNTADKKAYIWDGSAWQILAQDGATGATGATGADGTAGADGVSISWRGEFAIAPDSPGLNWAYYNTTQGRSYIWNGSVWQVLVQDGTPGNIITINDDGFWVINGTITEHRAIGRDGENGVDGQDGSVISIVDGYWYVDGVDTGIMADVTGGNIMCTVVFESNGGSAVPTQFLAYGAKVSRPVDPVRNGFAFVDWFNDSTLNTLYDFDAPVIAGIIIYAQWNYTGELPIRDTTNIATYLANISGGADMDDPVPLPISIELTTANWTAVLNAVNQSGKFVSLDLSLCTIDSNNTGGGLRTDGTFDPMATTSTGKNKIISLVLPNMATSILGGTTATFTFFSFLESVSGRNVTAIGNNTFSGNTALSTINFPKTTTIGTGAFANCPLRVIEIGLFAANLAFVTDRTIVESFSFPQAASIDANAFQGLISLTSVDGVTDFPLVASIGASAFQACISLESVSFPNVTSIGVSAFSGCTSLTIVNLPLAANIPTTAFANCPLRDITLGLVTVPNDFATTYLTNVATLQSVSFPQATSIANGTESSPTYGIPLRGAFLECTNLVSVDFPQVTSIGNNAFRVCTSLVSIDFPQVTSIGSNAFSSSSLISVDFPNVTSIGSSAFAGCTKLVSVSFPITSINSTVFQNCTNLESISFPNVTSIGGSAFAGCTSLESVSFPNVTSIGASAFSGCISLTTVSLPLAANIPTTAFTSCPLRDITLGLVTVPNNFAATYLSNRNTLRSVSFPQATSITNGEGSTIGAFLDCTSLVSVDFSQITSIGSNAFRGCTSLVSMDFPLVTSIGNSAFRGTGLVSVDFPFVTSIGEYAFYDCTSLVSVSFPLVTRISLYAFTNTTSLVSADFPIAASINSNAFGGCISLVNVSFPNVASIDTNAFYGCISLVNMSFPSTASIGNGAFQNCNNLASITINADSTISNTTQSARFIAFRAYYLNQNSRAGTYIWDDSAWTGPVEP